MLKVSFNQFLKIVTLLVFIILVVSLNLNATEQTDVFLPSFHTLTDFVDSNKYSHYDDLTLATNQQTLNTSSMVINTELGIVYLDEESLSFQLFNQQNYLISSTIDYESSTLSSNWKKRVRSALWVESYNTLNPNYAITEENLLSDDTLISITYIPNGFSANILFQMSKISLNLEVTFTQKGIKVMIPSNSIQEDGNFKLANIKVYPFFGAVLADSIPGYVFVPDGIGALVKYKAANKNIIGNYQKEIFDRNLSYNTEKDLNNFLSSGTRIYAPIFGFVHGVNQNGVFANIEEGAEYGLINLYYAGKTTDYTTIFSEFNYRKTYKQPIDKVGNTISLLQKERNQFNILINYSLLEANDANYVGMAKVYQDYLLKQMTPVKASSSDIPLKIDSIGIERKKGVLFNESVVMTTFKDLTLMVDDLNSVGINNIIINFAGFTQLGVTWSAPNYLSISSRLGSKEDIKTLKEKVTNLYLEGEFQKASSKGKGYSKFLDLAKKINDQYYEYRSLTDEKYLLKHAKTKELFEKSLKSLLSYGIDGMTINSLGSLLYQDFSNHKTLIDARTLYREMLIEADLNIALKDVNSYLWNEIDEYFDFPMYASQYLSFDDTVPFLSIVLKGLINLYSSNANFYPYARDELLRLIDFGVYPSFVITEKSSKYLQKTELEAIYSSKYQSLKEAVKVYYDFVNGALQYVIGAKICNRIVLPNHLVIISYDNNRTVIVNYTNQSLKYLDKEVLPKNYLVLDELNEIINFYQKGER